MPAPVEKDRIDKYIRLRRDMGFSQARAAREANVSRTWAWSFEKNDPSIAGGEQKRLAKEKAKIPEPKQYDELTDVAKKALDDFGFFRERYFARASKPWQEDAAYKIVELLEDSSQKSFAVVNVPPGGGKTTTFTHDIPVWLAIRNRRIRELLGSHGEKIAKQYTRRIRTSFERPTPFVDGERDVQAEGVLAVDFGRFKPEGQSDLWREDEFVVEQLGGIAVGEKEPTVMAAGQDTGFLGGRFEFCMWDDLVTPKNQRHDTSRTNQQEWWRDQAETRLEPGGLLVLMGQRIRADDLYRHCLEKAGNVVEIDGEQSRERKYHHIVYPAHFEDQCVDEHDPKEAKAWPEGCLLDPERLPWRELSTIKEDDPKTYETVYQQQDGDPEQRLVQDIWLFGGVDAESGIQYDGCVDYDRDIGEWPDYLPPPNATVVTVDPSPENWWSIQWWGLHFESESRVLLDHSRRRMKAPQFLDRLSGNKYVGLLVDWSDRAQRQGLRITHLIVERNAAQRFMHQYDFYRQFLRARGINLIPHDTHGNKADPEYGVWATLPTQYKNGRVRLPWKAGYGRRAAQPLVYEVSRWPEVDTEDCVMSQWFLEYNYRKIAFSQQQAPKRKVPSWMHGKHSKDVKGHTPKRRIHVARS